MHEVSKTVRGGSVLRALESLPLRSSSRISLLSTGNRGRSAAARGQTRQSLPVVLGRLRKATVPRLSRTPPTRPIYGFLACARSLGGQDPEAPGCVRVSLPNGTK